MPPRSTAAGNVTVKASGNDRAVHPDRRVQELEAGINDLLGFIANSTLSSRGAIARQAGLQFGAQRDLYEILGYNTNLRFDDYLGKYRRQDVAGRIVDIAPAWTWRKGFKVSDGTETSPFMRTWDELAKRLRIAHQFRRVDRLAGIGAYGVILIGARAQVEETARAEQPLQAPLERVRNDRDIMFLSAFHEGQADIVDFDRDPMSPRFGLPNIYEIEAISADQLETDRTGAARGQIGRKFRVHWTRIIHVAEDTIEDDTFGRPRLERVYNRLDDLEKLAGGGSEMFWLNVAQWWHLDIPPDFEISDEEGENLEALREKVQDAMHGLRRTIETQGADLELLGGQQPQPKDQAGLVQELISTGANTPKRILFGSERGELASTQDEANYAGEIANRQETFASPVIVRAFIDRMIAINALPTPAGGSYDVNWPNLFQLSVLQLADAAAKFAAAIAAQAGVTRDPAELVPDHEFRETIMGLPAVAPVAPSLNIRLRELAEDPRSRPGIDEFWRTVHRIAGGAEPIVRMAFLDAVAAARGALDTSAIRQALAGGDAARVERLITLGIFDREFLEVATPELLAAALRTAQLSARTLDAEFGFDFEFDETQSQIENFIEAQTAELIARISDESKKAIRMLIARGFREGIPPNELAASIESHLGLTAPQEVSVAKHRAELLKAGITGARLDRMVDEFAQAQVRMRAERVASHETLAASNGGQLETFRQLAGSGLVRNARKRWIVTPDGRLCPICEPLDDVRVELHEEFVSPTNGATAQAPPIHVSCRCAVSMVFERA